MTSFKDHRYQSTTSLFLGWNRWPVMFRLSLQMIGGDFGSDWFRNRGVKWTWSCAGRQVSPRSTCDHLASALTWERLVIPNSHFVMSRPAQLTKDSDPMLSQTPATIQPDDIATRQPFKPRDGTDSDKPSEVPCDALFEHTVDRPPSLPPVHVLPAMSWPGPSTRHADDGGTGPASAGHPDVLTPPVTPTQPG